MGSEDDEGRVVLYAVRVIEIFKGIEVAGTMGNEGFENVRSCGYIVRVLEWMRWWACSDEIKGKLVDGCDRDEDGQSARQGEGSHGVSDGNVRGCGGMCKTGGGMCAWVWGAGYVFALSE